MNVSQLYRSSLNASETPIKREFEAADLFECGQCKVIHRERTQAEKRCICDVCHRPQDPSRPYSAHADCWRLREEQNIASDIERAEKLENWDGPVIYDGEFYIDIESFVDRWPRDKIHFGRIFATKAESFPGVSYDDIEYRLCSDGYEDMSDDLAGTKELIAAIEKFNAANKSMVTHWEYRTRVVRVPEEKTDEI